MTNLNIAKLYLATTPTVTTAAQLETAVTSGAAATAVNALTGTALLNAIYNALFGRDADADGIAAYSALLTGDVDALIATIEAGAALYPTTGAFVTENTADKATLANKAAVTTTGVSEAQAVFILDTVTDSAATVTAANTTVAATVETANIAAYNTALTTYNTAVTTATASKAAADAAGLTVNSVTLATAYQTAANTAKTDADAVVTAATALSAAAAKTPSLVDDASSAIAVTGATTAQTAAAALVTDAAADLAAATAAAAAAAAVGTTFTLTTGADVTMFGTTKSDTWNATQSTYTSDDIIVDASTVDNDTLNVTATDDIANTPTIVGVENINFNLNAVIAGDTDFAVDALNISAGTINLAVTKAGSSVTTASAINVKDGVTVTTNLGALAVAGVADANLKVNLTKSAATLNQTGTIDDITVTATGDLTVASILADENVTITAGGDVTIATTASLNAGTDGAKNNLVITSGGNVNVGGTSASANLGDVSITAAEDIILAHGADDVVVLTTTNNGDVSATITAAKTVTITAAGDAGAITDTTNAVNDGDVTLSAAAATAVTVTAADVIALTTVAASKTTTLTAGNNSALTNITATEDLILASTNSAKTVVFDANTGSTAIGLETITFKGSNNVTLTLDGTDFVIATAALPAGQTKITATDDSTATSRIQFDKAVGGAADLSGLAVDEIAFTASDVNALTVANQANLVVAADLVNGLNVAAAAVPGNTLTVTIADDKNDTSVNDLGSLTVSNVATTTIKVLDTDATDVFTMAGVLNVGATNDVVITGDRDVNLGGVITAKTVNTTGVTGDVTIAAVLAATEFTTGAGDDKFTSALAQNLKITAGEGTDTLVLSEHDYSAKTLTLSGIDVIQATTTTTLAASQLTGKAYVINTGAVTVNVVSTTGEVANLSDIANSSAVTLNGNSGADTLTGSATTAMTIKGFAGADSITGGAAADTIDGGADNDNITAGNGADNITGGTGADTINLTETVSAIDTVVYTAVDQGSTVGVAAGTFSGYDVITGFTLAKDLIDVSSLFAAAGTGQVIAKDAATAALNDLTDADFTNVDKIVSFMNDSTVAGAVAILDVDVVAITFSNFTAIYAVNNAATAGIVAGEIELLATVNGVLTAAELV